MSEKHANRRRVVVTGMGVVSCFGTDPDKFFEKLLAGTSGVKTITSFDASKFETRIAGEVAEFHEEEAVPKYLNKKTFNRCDPVIRFGMVASKKALESAGFNLADLSSLDLEKCGIIVSSGIGGLRTTYASSIELGVKGPNKISPFFIPYMIPNMIGALTAIDLGFRGPNYSVSTACATGNYSIFLAAEHIRKGEADLMICGGMEAAVFELGLAGFIACRALSTNNDNPSGAARPWDKARDGFVMGDGGGVLVLESLEHAKKRGATILAEYLGGALSCDAHHMTLPHPDGTGVAQSIRDALKDAGVKKEDVNYINAHATCTPAGDLCEIRAIKSIFGDELTEKQIKINATKSMTGHALGGAAGLEAVVMVQSILKKKLHPTINCDDPEEEVMKIDTVRNGAIDHEIKVGLSNSFGFGGHNSTLVFAPYVEKR